MKFSYNWLKDLINPVRKLEKMKFSNGVKFKQSPEELADILTMYFTETAVKYKGKRPILEIELLANQVAHASSHLGLAREIGALIGKKVDYPAVNLKEEKLSAKQFLDIEIKTSNCNCYVAKVMQGVKVNESPKWLKQRLIDCGLRPINNIVDAANYVMLETGQPLHIFDFDKIETHNKNLKNKKKIIIRQAKQNEEITTLENITYKLNEEIMVIADDKGPLALAGLKGGKRPGISKKTINIVLESANFNGANIRTTSQKLRLKTDASWRFSHNISPELADYAVDRLAQLIQQISGGHLLQDKIAKGITKQRKILIPISWKNFEKFLGFSIKKTKIIHDLYVLGFSLVKKRDYILVSPPRFRNDLNIKEDVMGEIARLYGMNNIKSVLPKETLSIPVRNEFFEFREKIKDWLRGYSLEEVYNYSFISEKDKNILPGEWQEKLIEIKNPTSVLFKYLRPTLLINFIKNVNDNICFCEKIRFFEIGKLYFREKGFLNESFVFSGVLFCKNKKDKSDSANLFYEAKGIIENLFSCFGIDKNDYLFKSLESTQYQSLLEQGAAIYKSKDLIGVIGNPKKELLKKYDCEGGFAFWEIKLLPLLEIVNEEREFQPLPKYPAVIRDISFIIQQNVSIDKILDVIQKASPYNLEDVDLFDVYTGGDIQANAKSLSFHLIFRSKNHTLKNEEIDKEMEKIYTALKRIGAKIR